MALTEQARSDLLAKLQSVATAQDPQRGSQAPGTTVSSLLVHGMLQALVEDAENAAPRLAKHLPGIALSEVLDIATDLSASVADFFYRLDSNRYAVDSSLISFLTFPHEGKTWTPNDRDEPSDISVVFTFIGQFIDHDLTKNIIDLVGMQDGDVQDFATPMIDLDSVYGPRFDPDPPAPMPPMAGDAFELDQRGPKAFDVKRDANGSALIPDTRNDENQIILQIHLLLMRLHNTFVAKSMTFAQAKKETIFNWQSVVLNDYLPNVTDPSTLAHVIQALENPPGYGDLLHKPNLNPPPGRHSLGMPHEFGVGFRIGHSQLRSHYHLNAANEFPLFDNRHTGPMAAQDYPDLRGGRPLTAERSIDWPFFLSAKGHDTRRSNRIDTKVTQKVFDLPESTIPDKIKEFGNLPQRNLVRSSRLGLTSGEDLADRYGLPKLTPAEVESDPANHKLFDQQGQFRTPLWYYLLREAELKGNGLRLGPLGSRLVCEVVAGGVYYNKDAFVHDPAWRSAITNDRVVRFADIAAFVQQGGS